MRFTCSILFIIASAIALTSCKNNDNVIAPIISTGLTVVNASADTLNFYLNGTRQNNDSYLFPKGAAVNTVVPAGQQNYQFKKAGAASVLFSVPLNLTDSTYNSLYVAGETADLSFHTIDAIPVVPTSLTSDTSYIRFVNAATDAGNVSATISNVTTGQVIPFSGAAFKSSSAFTLLLTTGQSEIKIYQTSTNALKKRYHCFVFYQTTYTLYLLRDWWPEQGTQHLPLEF